MSIIDIFMTTWNRREFTEKAINLIYERTDPDTFQIHIFDNGSKPEMQKYLIKLLDLENIVSLHLDSRNTGCLYNKGIFHMMADVKQKYYVVTDNDVYPPKLSPDWLSQMIKIMDAHPDLAFLTPQTPPQFLSEPDHSRIKDDIVYCKAVGNILKLVRRKAFPVEKIIPFLGAYGDDGLVCDLARQRRYESAFCRNIFAFHGGQCDNWGYDEKEVTLDPRKGGYGEPFKYEFANEETYEPVPEHRI